MLTKLNYKIFIFLLVIFIVSDVNSQKINAKQRNIISAADKAFDNLEFYKAANLYQSVITDKHIIKYAIGRAGDCYWQLRDYKTALHWYEQLKEIVGDSVNFESRYVEALKANGKYTDAAEECKSYLSAHPGNTTIQAKWKQLESVQQFYADSAKREVRFLNINSNFRDFSPVFYKNDLAFISTRKLTEYPVFFLKKRYNIFYKYYENDKAFCNIFYTEDSTTISEPNSGINNFYLEHVKINRLIIDTKKKNHNNVGPFIFSKDGQSAYFNMNLDANKNIKRLGIFHADILKGELTAIQPFEYNNESYSVEHPALSPDSNYLYFASDKPGGYGKFDLYSCKRSGESWLEPKNLGNLVNTAGNEVFPYIDLEGNLYFSTDSLPGLGGLDLYYVKMKDGLPIEPPVNLGYPINSSCDDFGIVLDDSGLYGYLSSNRRNGNDDIYRFNNISNVVIPVIFKGIILDIISKLSIDSVSININYLNGANIYQYQTLKSGTFFLMLKTDTILDIEMKRPGYASYHQKVDTKKLRDRFLMVFLQPICDFHDHDSNIVVTDSLVSMYSLEEEINHFVDSLNDSVLTREAVHFDYNDAKIPKTDIIVLDSIIAKIKKHPETKLVIAGFTDCKGNDSSNKKISIKRSEVVKKYFLQKGISANRIREQHFYKKHMLLPCKEDTSFNKRKQIVNRRTEIIITKVKYPQWVPSGRELDIQKIIDSLIKFKLVEIGNKHQKIVSFKKAVPLKKNLGRNSIDSIDFVHKDETTDYIGKVKNEDSVIEAINTRGNKPPINIETISDSVLIELYDNGIFDYDTITVLFRNKLVVYKQILRTNKPISFYLKINSDVQENKLVFYAENFGLIPPNSALLIVTDTSQKRREIPVTTDLRQNTVIYFIKPVQLNNE